MGKTQYTYATEYIPVDAEDLDTPVLETAVTLDAAVRRARRLSAKEAPFGPTVYVLALLGDERVGQKVYHNGRCSETDGEGFLPASPEAA